LEFAEGDGGGGCVVWWMAGKHRRLLDGPFRKPPRP